ncbi:cupin domain-containing protein [Pseudooceanicola sp. HF7]|uniref:cupin domain-containing protein n=1 Tax=Pseudooceanicola sp. HF7 TaxID=2721560 RepID=UPI00142FE55D|nr:cupin domain-containing protein [Pseudooceanicola sp. HF7]NIZ11391.1 cupin domain-containing protein [Pseudooceanicola sp. HF7]
MTPEEIITLLDLAPHPEGGAYVETWRAEAAGGAHPTGTAIYFLLKEGEVSHWHKIVSTEVWHHYAGAPVELRLSPTEAGPAEAHVLGKDLAAGERPQVIVPPGYWQAARPMGGWALVGCTVSPGFDFKDFVLADPSFDIPAAPDGSR